MSLKLRCSVSFGVCRPQIQHMQLHARKHGGKIKPLQLVTVLLTSSPLWIHRRALERKRKARIEEGPGGRSLRKPEDLQDFPGLCPHTPSTWCRETGPEFLFPSAISGEQTTRNHQMMVPCFLPLPQKDFVHTLICCLVRGPKRANATGAPI